MKKDYQKAWKKLTSFFLSNPVPFNRQSYQKQKVSGAVDQSLFKSQNKLQNIPLFSIYYLTKCDDVMKNRLWFILKFTSGNLCKPVHDTMNYSTSICPFESRKCGKDGIKLQKFEYLHNEKSFLVEIKSISHSFKRAIIWWKNENLIKNSGHKLQQTIVIHILPNISRSKDSQTVKFGQLIECNIRSIFLEKSYTKCGRETSPRLFLKN